MRRGDSGKPNSRPSLRPHSRAHPRLQHGVPPGCARGRRRLRSAVSHRGRRRRHLLEACRLRLASRLRPGGGRLAPSPRQAARVLAPAAGVRPRRGAARAQVAGEVQRRWARLVGRAAVPAPPLRTAMAPPASAVRDLGHGRLPARGAIPLVHLGGAHRNSRVLPPAGRARGPVGPGSALASAALGAAGARARSVLAPGAHRGGRVQSAARYGNAQAIRAHSAAVTHLGPPPCPAVRTSARTSQPRADSLAPSRPARARGPASAECLAVERVVARAVCLDPFDRDRPEGGRSCRPTRRADGPMGSRGARWPARRRAPSRGRRRARRGQAARPHRALAASIDPGRRARGCLCAARGQGCRRRGSCGGERARGAGGARPGWSHSRTALPPSRPAHASLERPLPEPAAPSPVLSENGGAPLPHVLAEQEAER